MVVVCQRRSSDSLPGGKGTFLAMMSGPVAVVEIAAVVRSWPSAVNGQVKRMEEGQPNCQYSSKHS